MTNSFFFFFCCWQNLYAARVCCLHACFSFFPPTSTFAPKAHSICKGVVRHGTCFGWAWIYRTLISLFLQTTFCSHPRVGQNCDYGALSHERMTTIAQTLFRSEWTLMDICEEAEKRERERCVFLLLKYFHRATTVSNEWVGSIFFCYI